MIKHLFKQILFILLIGSAASMKSQCGPVAAPYFQDFSGLTANNQLPACWAASSLGGGCKTFFTQGGSAAFLDVSSGPHYFYSRALSLSTGVTYSVSLWKKSSLQNSTNGFLAVFLNTSQSGGQTIISSPAPVTSTIYSPTTNTFNVTNTGTYYIAIAGAYMGSGTGEHLYWDDLRVDVPCTFAGNSPTVTITSSSPTICAGSSPTLYANGADTYTWFSGAQTSSIIVQQHVTTQFTVTGTSTLTGCSAIATFSLPIMPTPVVTAISTQPSVCIGKSVMLNASGAPSYLWSTGATSPATSVSPNSNTTYTVTGTNVYGCSAMATVFVGVYSLPTISITPTSYTLCEDEIITLVASGGTSYLWSNSPFNTASSLTVRPPAGNFTYTVKGFNNDGCESSATSKLEVSECVVITEGKNDVHFKFFPNPCKTHISFEGIDEQQILNVYDVTGRKIISTEIYPGISLDVSFLKSGTYFVKIKEKNMRLIKE